MQLQQPEVKKEQEIKEQGISQTRINPIKTEVTQTVMALVSSAKSLNENSGTSQPAYPRTLLHPEKYFQNPSCCYAKANHSAGYRNSLS
jgi:hypothetical protein